MTSGPGHRAHHGRLIRGAGMVLCGAVTTLAPAAGRAHGPTPEAVDVFLRAAAPSEVVMATNFGLLLSADAGLSWSWLCEESFGSYAVNRYALGPDGSVYVGSFDGLFTASGIGAAGTMCDFALATGAIEDHNVVDVAPNPTNAVQVFALGVPLADGGADTATALFESTDGGKTFARLPDLPPTVKPLRLLIAPDGHTLYMTAFVDDDGLPSPRILRRDAGTTDFAIVDLSSLLPDELTRLVIDPADPMHVFFVTSGPTTDRLFESTTGGPDPTELLRVGDHLKGLALGDDAQQIYVGAQESRSLHHSEDGGKTWFMAGGGPHYLCLGARGNELWACGDWRNPPFGDGLALARSPDRGGAWGKAADFVDLNMRTAACVSGQCGPSGEWLCTFVCSTGEDGGLGGGGERRDAGPRPEPRDGPAGDGGPKEDGGGGGCGCHIAGERPTPWVLPAMAAAWLTLRRRRPAG